MSLEAALEDGLADLGVERRERVVKEVDVRAAVGRARDGDALLLAAAEVDAALADLGLIACGQDADVARELAGVDDLRVGRVALGLGLARAHAVRLAREDDVLAHARVEHPRGLRNVGDATAHVHAAAVRHLAQLAEQRLHKRRLAAAD